MDISNYHCPQCDCLIPQRRQISLVQQTRSIVVQIIVGLLLAALPWYCIFSGHVFSGGMLGSGKTFMGTILVSFIILPLAAVYIISRLFPKKLRYKCNCGFDGTIWYRTKLF
jgi:hypothetical protein